MRITGIEIIRLNEVDSTQDELRTRVMSDPIQEGTVVTARKQGKGRGLGENVWESEEGANLLMSLLWKPVFLHVSQQFLLTKVVSLAVADLMQSIIQQSDIRIKWPNDVYVGDRKIAGILIENSIIGEQFQYCLIGIGININQTAFSKTLPNPVSLSQLKGNELSIDHCLQLLCEFLDQKLLQLKNDIRSLNTDYLNRLYRFNTTAPFLIDKKQIEARITGVSPFGMLQLAMPDGKTAEFDMKQIKFIM